MLLITKWGDGRAPSPSNNTLCSGRSVFKVIEDDGLGFGNLASDVAVSLRA